MIGSVPIERFGVFGGDQIPAEPVVDLIGTVGAELLDREAIHHARRQALDDSNQH